MRGKAAAPVVLVMLSVFFLRPNIGGERLAPIGFGLALLAAVVVVLMRTRADYSDVVRPVRALYVLVVCLGLAYVWLLLKSSAQDPFIEVQAALQDFAITVGGVAAIALVCQEVGYRIAIGRGLVLLIVVCCASYAVTALMWAGAGVGFGQIGTIPVGDLEPQPLYFPFTVTASTQDVLGITFPRFTGIGREPGWMAMYCAAAFFLADLVELRAKIIKPLLVLGLLGCVSTAGFGVFVVVWAYGRFLRARGGISMANYLRQIGGIGAIAGAAWLAVDAPVFGLSAKSTQNGVSLDRRTAATEAGLRALFSSPWGGQPTEEQGGVNLVSDIAVNGLPFVVLVTLALLLPIAFQRATGRGNAVALVVFLTMLTSQPAGASTWAFGIVLVAYACQDLTDDEREQARVARRPRKRTRKGPLRYEPTTVVPARRE